MGDKVKTTDNGRKMETGATASTPGPQIVPPPIPPRTSQPSSPGKSQTPPPPPPQIKITLTKEEMKMLQTIRKRGVTHNYLKRYKKTNKRKRSGCGHSNGRGDGKNRGTVMGPGGGKGPGRNITIHISKVDKYYN